MPTNEQQIKRGEIALGVRPDLSTLPLQMSQDGFLWTAQGGSVSTTGTNTTTTPLSTGATFTGSAELNTFPDVGVSCHTDGGGTLYFDFSNDGTNWNTFPTAGFTVVANIHEFHTASKLGRYFRVRYVNGSTPQTYLRLYTYYGTFRHSNAPIGFTIQDDADAQVVKAVLAGVGTRTVGVSDLSALYVTPPPEGKSAFGESLVAEMTPIVQVSFPYSINSEQVESRENQSGTVTHANRMANIASGAAANSSAEMRTRTILKYNPGQGVTARFTAVFTTAAANSTQIVGIGNESDGLFYGYNGTSFGILHRRDGSPEVRTLTITTKSSTAESITITLDSTAASVPVTNGADATVTANEIAAYDYSDVGKGWRARALGNKVEFVSWDAAAHSGTFSLSGSSSAVGTFSQNVVGTTATETWIAQESWNGEDIFDGNGITGVTLDPTKGNVYQIKYQWLGFGKLSFYIEDPDDGEMHLVHSIEYANANTTPSMGDPSLPVMAKATNTSNTSSMVIKVGSIGAFVEGVIQNIGIRLGARSVKTDVTTSLRPILSIRQGTHFNSKAVHTFSRALRLAGAIEHTKTVTMVVILNGTLTGASWSSINSDISALQVDTTASAITGGVELFSIPLGKTGQETYSFDEDLNANILVPGDTLTIAAIASSGTNGEAAASLKLLERL